MFALGRLPGWVAHATEQYAAKTLIRPRLRYDGPTDLEYVPIEERGQGFCTTEDMGNTLTEHIGNTF